MNLKIKILLFIAYSATLLSSGWIINGWRWEAKYADRVQEARKTEQSLQASVDAITNRHASETRRIANERDAAIERLRQRPARLPEDSRANCKGSTGAELSREDGVFLIREASAAAICWQELRRAYDYADEIQGLNDQ